LAAIVQIYKSYKAVCVHLGSSFPIQAINALAVTAMYIPAWTTTATIGQGNVLAKRMSQD
jgi:hypothetical protein